MISHELHPSDAVQLLDEHAALLQRGERQSADTWALGLGDPELSSLMALAGHCQAALPPLAMPTASRDRLRRDLLRQATARPASDPSWRAQGTSLARRSIGWLGRPEGRWFLGGGAAVAAGLGLALALHRRHVLRASRQGA